MKSISRTVNLCLLYGILLLGFQLESAYASVTVSNGNNRTKNTVSITGRHIESKSISGFDRLSLSKSLETVPESASDVIRLVLKLDERRVYVYRGEVIEESYPVAIGKDGWETPKGLFQVFAAIENPGWTNPFTNERVPRSADSPLGDRWIAFWSNGEALIGFHGTPDRESVGQAMSHGCVRMYNEDIRELFELVDIGTPVIVTR